MKLMTKFFVLPLSLLCLSAAGMMAFDLSNLNIPYRVKVEEKQQVNLNPVYAAIASRYGPRYVA